MSILPIITGMHLESREEKTFPKDFAHGINVVIMGFTKEQKEDSKLWQAALLKVKQEGQWKDKDVDFYSLPIMVRIT